MTGRCMIPGEKNCRDIASVAIRNARGEVRPPGRSGLSIATGFSFAVCTSIYAHFQGPHVRFLLVHHTPFRQCVKSSKARPGHPEVFCIDPAVLAIAPELRNCTVLGETGRSSDVMGEK
jgi:hypothetical protein